MTTERTQSERDVAAPIDCDRFDALLADYLENDLRPEARATADAHLADCGRCRTLTDDLLAITRGAAALGPIEPARDLWTGIAARIEAPVVPIGRTGEQPIARPSTEPTAAPMLVVDRAPRHRFLYTKRWLAAAASVLVATSVGSTYAVMRVAGNDGPARPTVAATSTPVEATPATTPAPVPAPTVVAAVDDTMAPAAAEPAAPRPRASERRATVGASDLRAASVDLEASVPAVRTYDREITTLRAALRRRTDLDSSTVVVLERSLKIIDDAIAESRRALARDPNSRLLGDQLGRALDQKVELLRTAVLLPSRS